MGSYNTDDKNAPEKLANLMHREMGVTISPALLRLFLRSHWAKVSMLAHQIHEQE